MRKQVQQSGIALNVVSEIDIIINDSLQVVNTGGVISASEV